MASNNLMFILYIIYFDRPRILNVSIQYTKSFRRIPDFGILSQCTEPILRGGTILLKFVYISYQLNIFLKMIIWVKWKRGNKSPLEFF